MDVERWFDEIPWLGDLPEIERAEFVRAARIEQFRKERTIYYQDDPASGAFLIIDGTVRQVKWTDRDSTILIGQAYPRDWLALAEAMIRGVYLADATTNTESVVASVQSEDLHRLTAHKAIRRRIIREMAAGYYLVHGIIEAHSPRTRIARYLYTLLARASSTADGITLAITQDAVAQAVGLTRETVNKHLHVLEDLGILALGRGVVRVVDVEQLRFAAG